MRAWQIISNQGVDALHLGKSPVTEPRSNEVRVKMHASSINYRDYLTILDPESRGLPYPRIPNSDAAGEIVAVGPDVIEFKPGDRVATCFFQDWADGSCSPQAMASALGGALDGVLTEETVLPAEGVIGFPEHLSYAQAATLPCAALTAWHGLVEVGNVQPGDTVLLLGTGGVSIFALQFATLLGARAIITSSSDAKLARTRELGAWQTINYRARPDWEQAVMDLTEGKGADVTIEVGGAGTLTKSVAATRVAGTIALIGVLTGGQIDPTSIMRKSIRLQGVYVGSRRMFRDMNKMIGKHRLEPVIDKHFEFENAPEAFHEMASGRHFGKLVIDI